MKKDYFSENLSATRKIAKKLAENLMEKPRKGALVLALTGDLGSGKTTFLKSFARTLGVKRRISSPTFVIVKKNKIPGRNKFANFFHIDCYRIKGQKEISVLGFDEMIKDRENVVAIEWAGKIAKKIPLGAVWVKFEVVSRDKRKIIIGKR